MNILVVLFSLSICCLAAPRFNEAELLDELWEAFKFTHGKCYSSMAEEIDRRVIWEYHLKMIEKHNAEVKLGMHTYTLGMNQFGDTTVKELMETQNGYNPSGEFVKKGGVTFLPPNNIALPDEVDWRKEGYVTPVKNQKQCGSCWAFSATGSLEGQMYRKTGSLVSLSEQNLVDCSWKEGNHGCNGGLMDKAFTYIKINGGIDTEKSYPYVGRNQKCAYNKSNIGGEDTGYVDIPSGSELRLKQAVGTVGPVSVAIDASSEHFMLYHGGIYVDHSCSRVRLNHGVLAVGYGTTNSTDGKNHGDYWIVKNSWGKTWGTKGYIKMARNRKNMCGIATEASYPLV